MGTEGVLSGDSCVENLIVSLSNHHPYIPSETEGSVSNVDMYDEKFKALVHGIDDICVTRICEGMSINSKTCTIK